MNEEGNFEEDPYLVGISPEALQVGVYKRTGVVNNTSFGLPLVSCWRSFPTSMEEPYRMLISKTASCLETKEAHLYPFDDLHVTIATFRSLLDPNPPTTDEDAESIKQFCVNVMASASKRNGWPTKGSNFFLLKPKEIRLHKKNAIILWEETTGNLESMRKCLKEEMEARDNIITHFSVPNIVHSTILRFWKCPCKPEMIIQAFKESNLIDILPVEIDVQPNVKLVCEDIPCMHINDDEHHVLWKDQF